MKNLTLEHIADACHGIYIGPEEARNICVTAITSDSRKVEEGCLFVPIVGARADGHTFISQVMEAGAGCTLSEKELGDVSFPYIKINSSLQAVKDIAAYYLEQLQIPVIGITGSVGKTSTKEMIAAVLEQKYRVLKTQGNFNNELGLPLTVFRLRDEDEIAVLEMGISDFNEMHRLAAIAKPNTCVITNIGTCHLENLGDRDGVLKAKTEVFDPLKPNATVILNGDDDMLCVSVRDWGVGIPRMSRSLIYSRYVRLDNHKSDVKGFGLGLSYVHLVAQSFGGSIAMEECGGVGSKFVLKIPDDND